MSDIFSPLELECKSLTNEGLVNERKFYMVDVETFKEPIVVIPQMGTKSGYLLMKPRASWADDFVAWIQMPHKYDKMEMAPLPEDEVGDDREEEVDERDLERASILV